LGQYIGMQRPNLEAGRKYPVYLEAQGQGPGKGFGMKLMWMSTSEPFAEIPSSQYYPDPDCPIDLRTQWITATGIGLQWDDRSTRESGYTIERSMDGELFDRIATAAADQAQYSDAQLTPASTYHYRVAARVNGSLSQYSNVITVSTASGRDNLVEWSAIGKMRGYDTLSSLFCDPRIESPVAMVRGPGLKDHGYRGWAHHRPSVVFNDFARAIDSGDYVSCTIIPKEGASLDLDYLKVNALHVPRYPYSYALLCDANGDNYATVLDSFVQSGAAGNENDTFRLAIGLSGINEAVTFRLAITSDSANDFSNVVSFKDTLGVMAFELAGTAHGEIAAQTPFAPRYAPEVVSSIELVNMQGRIFYHAHNKGQRRNFLQLHAQKIDALPAGVYIMRIEYRGSKAVARTRCIGIGFSGRY
jgi:hypothetical protein